MRDYLTLGDVLAIHADQITTYGGAAGIRDPGQLDAALFRPQTGYYADIIAEAAALWESLSQNHPFVDGNKRTAFRSAVHVSFHQRRRRHRRRRPGVGFPVWSLSGRRLQLRRPRRMASRQHGPPHVSAPDEPFCEPFMALCGYLCNDLHMATNLAIRPELLERALELSGKRTKTAAVTLALQEFVARREQRRLLDLFDSLDWDPTFDCKAERSRE